MTSSSHPSWKNDTLLKRVLRNSGHLLSSSTISAALGFAQGILAVRLLGIEGYGLVNGTIMVFATNVNRVFSFRMSEVTAKYVGESLAQNNKPRAAALVKGIGLAEAATSILAYIALLLLAPWAAENLAKDPSTAPLIRTYGLFLLANLVYETATGVLQTFKRFDRLGQAGLLQSVLTASLIGAAFIWHGSALDILLAYLAGKFLSGIAVTWMAAFEMNRQFGANWWRASVTQFHTWRDALKFIISTNLNGTVSLVVRDSAPLFLAAFSTQAEVGYFKLALSLINVVMLPIEPFIWPTYVELVETIHHAQWDITRRLLRRVSLIAAAWTLGAGGVLAVIGGWLIPFVYGAPSAPAYPATLILLVGFGYAYIFHWSRTLMLALGKPAYTLIASALIGVVQVTLVLIYVPRYGYLAMAWLLTAYFIVSTSVIVWRGLADVKIRATTPVIESSASA